MSTTYYFIRHAEKNRNGGRNPHLTETGKSQAIYWGEILADKGIEQIYCTSLIRTRETALPLAEKLGLPIKIYDVHDLYSSKFQKDTRGKTVLIVGHQDTTPAFVNRILQTRKYPYIESKNHGNLYRVSISDKGKISSDLSHIDL